MTAQSRRALLVIVGGLLLTGAYTMSGAQPLFTSGQNVQPVFEGWERNPDGTTDMLFGYLNRNYDEQPHIPIGPNNSFSQGMADRGQPTHFYPRRQSFVFRVTVPADWGKKDLVWTLTHNGRTSTATGSLMPVWQIDEGVWKANRGSGIFGRTSKTVEPNERPAVEVPGDDAHTIGLSETLTLTAMASDDARPGRRENLRRPQTPAVKAEVPIQTPGIPFRGRREGPNTQDMVSARAAYETGLAISWLHYRGPGSVMFQPRTAQIQTTDGTLKGSATTAVRFSAPGTYVLSAVADDGIFTSSAKVTVTVKAAVPATDDAARATAQAAR